MREVSESTLRDYLKEDVNFPIGIPSLVWAEASKRANSHIQFCSYLQSFMGDVVERVFAFQHKSRKDLEITEVIRRHPGVEGQVIKNLYFSKMAGYRAVFERKDVISRNHSYYGYGYQLFHKESFNRWEYDCCQMNPYTRIVNVDALFKIDKYEYCAWNGLDNLMYYLRAYNKNPKVEYFGKMGIIYSPALMRKAEKDKQFINFLRNSNPYDINNQGIQATIYAYDHHMTITQARNALYVYNRVCRKLADWIPEIKYTKIDRMKLDEYIEENEINMRAYNDYLHAIKELGMNLEDTKNIYPREFQRMHDLRIGELASKKAKEDRERSKEMYLKFATVSQKYMAAGCAIKNEDFCIVLPGSPDDLKKEGEFLHHCVGKMGYDLKMANGTSLIAFVRMIDKIDMPYVTVEWDPVSKKVRQCYGDHDSRPEENIIQFVDEWAEHMKGIAV